MEAQIEAGKTYSVRYPFVSECVELPPDDPNVTQFVKVKSWRPGVAFENDGYGNTTTYADAFGEMLLTVVAVYKPGRYPTRVFYTRQWTDPDGKVFGNAALRITTQERFRRISRCYQHDVYIGDEKHEPITKYRPTN